MHHRRAIKHWHEVCLRFTVSIQEVTLIFLVISSLHLLQVTPQVGADEICGDIDIRNSVDQFRKLENCTVIEGILQILLIDNSEPADFLNLTFPKLHEITGFFLLYRVQGLTTLSNIFPNLTVIRGAKLFLNFALIIYQMQSLKEIGLPSLTIIQRGSVYIEENSQLCYVDTIDWDLIVQIGKNDNFFKSNQESNQCPNNCPSDKKCPTKNIKGRDVRLCWNKHHCQKTCPPGCNYCTPSGDKCCHESCLGGCSGEGRDSCFACTHFVYGGKCLDKCLPGTFEFANRRCITDKDCFKMDTKKLGIFERSKKVYWKLFDNKCLSECPEGHVADNKNQTMCLKCDGACPKVCQGVVIDSISSAQSLKGCTRINGHLEIQIKAGKNIVKELEESLSSIKEVDDYVKITRSFPLISLNFMKNIEKIHGNKKIKNEYSLYVLENNNLQELIETNYSKLSIVSGKVFFHNNPKLCKNKIVNFLNKISFTNWTDNDVSSETNGDRVACTVSYLKAEVYATDSTFAFVRWSSFKNLSDHRFLIGYVVSYKEALFKNVSLYDGRDACGTDTWKVDDILANTDDNKVDEVHILTNLKPFTQYAVSIKTYTISREQDAQSAILYFQTLPDTPSSPVNVKGVSTSPSSLIISWLPPNKPNGTITYYTVIVKRQPYNEEVLYQRNYCSSPLIISDPTKKPPDPEPPLKTNKTDFWSHPKILPESCCECPKEKSSLTEEEKEKEFRIKFEDTLHNYVYVKKTKSNSGSRQKRNVDESITSTILTTTLNSTKYMNDFSKDIEIIIEPLEIYNNVTYNTSIKIRGLKHFTEYSFEIKACQDSFENRTSDPCSSKSIATARTLKKANADDIDSTSVFITVLNDTSGKVFVKWNRPIDSNGLIVTYELEYAKKNIDNLQPTRVCITQSQYLKEGGYKLDNLDAGNYSIRIHAVSLAGDGNWTIAKYFVITKSTNGIPSHVLIASIVGGIVVFLIVGSCIIYFIIKKSLHKIPNGVLYASVNPDYMSTVYVPDEWEIPRDKITLLGELGQGSFGMVYEGIFKDLEEGKHEIRCAIKTVNESATVRERIEFLNEASVMKAFSCHHVVKLIGVVSKGQPTFVVMELMANGDLKSYLRLHRPDSEDADRLPPPTLKQILQMACEIADGMGYLAAKKFVHRDLAARNCMVSEDLTVKIGDFGMTRDIYETDYYRKGGKGLLPVRWMAPESLKDGVFTSQSDVWSYGIVLWEMATLASQPYQGLSNEQVLKYVVEGGTMEKPENCPDRLYNLMAICWSHNPKTRPSFLELVSMLVADSSPCFHQVSFFSTQSNGLSYDVVEIEEALPTTPLKTNTQIASNPAIEMNSKTNSVDKNKFPFDEKDYFVETIEVTKENAVPVAEGSKGVRTNETLVNGHIHFPLTNNVKC